MIEKILKSFYVLQELFCYGRINLKTVDVLQELFCYPGLTKTSYHTISIYEKLLVIQFHTIPYVQKIV